MILDAIFAAKFVTSVIKVLSICKAGHAGCDATTISQPFVETFIEGSLSQSSKITRNLKTNASHQIFSAIY